jgi:hypothetical protein
VEGRRLDALLDGPGHGAVEDVGAVLVEPEDEAGVDHDSGVVQAPYRRRVVGADVLVLAALGEIRVVDGLEADEQAAQTGLDRPLQQVGVSAAVRRGCAGWSHSGGRGRRRGSPSGTSAIS